MNAVTASTDRRAFLRRVLTTHAAICLAIGVLLSLGSYLFAPLFALPRLVLECLGLGSFPIAAFIAWTATRDDLWQLGVWVVIAGSALSAGASVLLLVSDVVSLNPIGYVLVIVQAVAATLLAGLEYIGLRRTELDSRFFINVQVTHETTQW